MPACSQENRSEGEAWPGSCLLTSLLTAPQIHLLRPFCLWLSSALLQQSHEQTGSTQLLEN